MDAENWSGRKVAYSGDVAFVAGGWAGARRTDVVALGLDGKGARWNASFDGFTTHDLVATDGAVVLGAYDAEAPGGGFGRMLGLDAATGRLLWERPPRDERPWQVVGAAATEGAPVVVLADRTLEGIDARTGEVEWSWETPLVASVLRADGDAVFLRVKLPDGSDGLAALDLATGEERWTARVDQWPEALRGDDPLLLVGRAAIVALDAQTGEERWRAAGPPPYPLNQTHAARAEPSGLVVASDLRSGREAWRFQAEAASWFLPFSDARGYSGPTLASRGGDGVLLLATNESRDPPRAWTRLWGLDDAGRLQWERTLEGRATLEGEAGGGLLLRRGGGSTTEFVDVSAATGEVAWTCSTGEDARLELRDGAAFVHTASAWSRLRLE